MAAHIGLYENLTEDQVRQFQEDLTMSLCSIATKCWGRWAMLNLMLADNLGQYLLENLTWGTPFVFLIALTARAFFEICLILWQERGTENYAAAVYHRLTNIKIAKRCGKTALKFAVVYTSWATAASIAQTLLATTVLAACWQLTLTIIAAAIITALTMALISYLVDDPDTSIDRRKKGLARGLGEGIMWTFIEYIDLFKVVGTLADIFIVAISVSLSYFLSGQIEQKIKKQSTITSNPHSFSYNAPALNQEKSMESAESIGSESDRRATLTH